MKEPCNACLKSGNKLICCVSVCYSALSQADLKFGMRNDLDNRSDEFKGQGHKSKTF